MKNWFEKRSTTNILLLGIGLLLGAHLLMNLPLVSSAKAQLIGANDTTAFNYVTSPKMEEYLKSIDKNITDIKNNSALIHSDLRFMQDCIMATPTGVHAFRTKEVGVQ